MSEDCKSDAIGIGRQTDDFCPVRWRNIFHCSLVEASDTRLCILHHANPAESYGSNRGRGSLCEWGISVLIAINILESHHKPGSKLDREGTKKNAKWYVLGVLTKQLGWQKIRRNLKEQRPSTKWVVRREPTQAFGMEWPPSLGCVMRRQAENSVWETHFSSLCLGEMQMRVNKFLGAHCL